MTISENPVELYRRWQELLARYGDADVTTDAFSGSLIRSEADPFLDVDGFERILDQLHVKAFPDAKTRPPRLYAHELEDVRED